MGRGPDSESARAPERRLERLVLLFLLPVCAALVLAWLVPVRHAWGWDESMHAELPAVRMLLALEDGRTRDFVAVLHECEQYPFVWPLALLAAQWVLGIGEAVARGAGWVAFAALLALVHAIARELERDAAPPGSTLARRVAPLFALLAALVVAYAPTLFLEVPSALAVAATLFPWLRWKRAGGAGAALLASACATAAFFTKFNYGVLLAAGLALDALQHVATAARGSRAARARAALWLVPIPALALAWWLAWPLPFGAEVARSHRAALAGFLGGNLEMPSAPWSRRMLHVAWLAGSPLQALVLAVGAGATLAVLRHGAVRTLWILLVALELPALAHPFHLDRFLVPGAPVLWCLAALGWSRLAARARAAAPALLALCAVGWISAPWQMARLAALLGALPADAVARAWATDVLDGWVHPDPRRRVVATGGLARDEHDLLLDLLARELGPTERVGWPAISSELSPAALHLGLLARGGSRERFLADAHRPIYLSIANADPGLAIEQTLAWAEPFDVLVLTEPPDLKARSGRAWLEAHQRALVESRQWVGERIGEIVVARGPGSAHEVAIVLARKAR